MYVKASEEYPKEPERKVFTVKNILSFKVYKRKQKLSKALINLAQHDFIAKRKVSQILYPPHKRKERIEAFIKEEEEWNKLMRKKEEDIPEDMREFFKLMKDPNEFQRTTIGKEKYIKHVYERAKEMEMQKRELINIGTDKRKKNRLSKRHLLIYLNENGVDLARKLEQYEFRKSVSGKAFIKFIKSCA
jgi:hypothetical protein